MQKTSQLVFTLFSTLAALAPVWSTPIIFCDLVELSPYITAITPGTAVTGLGLTQTSGAATLTKGGFHGGWNYADGGLGAFDGCHYWWLNIGTSSTSVKPLTWAFDDQITTIWSGGPGVILTTIAPVSNGTFVAAATSEFIACKESGSWVLYLQQGTDVPKGNCVKTQLQEGTSNVIA
ncbi:hypothetical protein FRB94_011726 [Tulasnella sp. JGI-2019a]|nr:hypothetical protein FRB94_011726 [Tulasnella sp. JGI-2019a]KAG9002309.1 hypothetical protein FRB93_011735 [Tulasnella sp. JGI-2019a]